MSLDLRIEPLELPLVHPFRTARGEETTTGTALFRLANNGVEALGESSPIARYGESIGSIIEWYARHPLRGNDPFAFEELLSGVPPAARCGLDLALHDLVGKKLGVPLFRLLGLDPTRTPVTSFTVGIADPQTTLQKVREAGNHPVLKIKLGLGSVNDQIETIEAVRFIYDGAIRIDANEGWSAESAVAILRELDRFDIEFCEQPIPAGSPQQLQYIRERASIPIVADEDAKDATDLPALMNCVDGINIKLVKCGGIRGALAMIHTARAMGLKIMLGCMVESAILATAAAHLSPLVDWTDLDGPFLTAHDPFSGVTYDGGHLILPDGPGLGVREATVVA
ncbi:MAG: dipeptide epimerase [Candidatus Meridianibacter frigidus]|nr:MAG: dipeptide epimerase [Candidatus Eremiobacteraeota bacterium]